MAQVHNLQGVPILVLDDDPDCLALFTFALRLEGAVVSATNSVAAAQTSFLAQPPQLVVSDLALPGTTGYDFIAWVRALSPAAGGRVPVLALTGHGERSRPSASLSGWIQRTSHEASRFSVTVAGARALAAEGSVQPGARSARVQRFCPLKRTWYRSKAQTNRGTRLQLRLAPQQTDNCPH